MFVCIFAYVHETLDVFSHLYVYRRFANICRRKLGCCVALLLVKHRQSLERKKTWQWGKWGDVSHCGDDCVVDLEHLPIPYPQHTTRVQTFLDHNHRRLSKRKAPMNPNTVHDLSSKQYSNQTDFRLDGNGNNDMCG